MLFSDYVCHDLLSLFLLILMGSECAKVASERGMVDPVNIKAELVFWDLPDVLILSHFDKVTDFGVALFLGLFSASSTGRPNHSWRAAAPFLLRRVTLFFLRRGGGFCILMHFL